MAKFKINQTVKTTQTFKNDFKRIFKKQPDIDGGVIIDIYEDGKSQPIYFFTLPDKNGNRKGLAEQFLEAV